MKTTQRAIGAAALVSLLAAASEGRAQSTTYTLAVDANGNVVKVLPGTGYSKVQAVVASIAPQTTTAPPAPPSGWSNVNWGVGARDVAVGPNGTAYFVTATGTVLAASPSGTVSPVGGGYVIRVAVDKGGTPWCITSGKAVFRYQPGAAFVQVPGSALDIAAGGDGSVWIVKPDNSLAKWNGAGWTDGAVGGGGSRIAVDAQGNPWVANASNQVFRWTGSTWQQVPGAVTDIAIGLDGATYALGVGTGPGGYLAHQWVPSQNNWTAIGFYATVIGPGLGQHAFAVRSQSLLPTVSR